MNRRLLINTGIIFALTMAFVSVAKAQSSSIQFANGVTVAIQTETVPPSNSNSLGNIYSSDTIASDSVVHRVMTDTKNKIYFGYDVVVEKQVETGKFKVSIKPLSKSPAQLLNKYETQSGNTPDYVSFTSRSLPKYPEAVILNDGDSITLDILENLQTRSKISDIIKIISKPIKFGSYFSEREKAKDFTIRDVNLRLDQPEVSINGEKSKIGGGTSGNVVWVSLTGKGRFIFSFLPQPEYDFQKTGIILDNKIIFDYKGESYQFVSKSPILDLGGKWNLWIMFDENYQLPRKFSPESPYSFGAADKVEYLFDNR